jgi:outer membrane protein assembly factor BamA
MKKLIIILFWALSFFSAFGQEENNPFFFKEFYISINRTNLSDDNTENRYGFGLSANRIAMEHRKINFVFGFEYNLTKQFKNKTYEGHYAHATDLEYTLNNLSVPLNFRVNFGKNNKVFFETGLFLDLIFGSQRKGKIHTYAPDENNVITYKVSDFEENARLSTLNYGIAGGIGLRVPFDKFEMIIKADYKLGIRELDSFKTSILNSYIRLNIGVRL